MAGWKIGFLVFKKEDITPHGGREERSSGGGNIGDAERGRTATVRPVSRWDRVGTGAQERA